MTNTSTGATSATSSSKEDVNDGESTPLLMSVKSNGATTNSSNSTTTNISKNGSSSVLQYLGDHFEASHGAMKVELDLGHNNNTSSSGSAPQFPPLPPCCDANGYCQKATVLDCCATGVCTAVPPFMPLELLQKEPLTNNNNENNGPVVRSTLYCQHICCSAEVPIIHTVLEPLEGIFKIMINVPLRQVAVDHDPHVIAAEDLRKALNDHHLGATILRHATATASDTPHQTQHRFVTSILKSANDLQHLQEPAVRNALQTYNTTTHLKSLEIAGNMITLQHGPLTLPLDTLVKQLQDVAGIATVVLQNGGDDIEWEFPTYEQVTTKQHTFDNTNHKEDSWPKPAVLLSGFCWIVSMLSLLGGPYESFQYMALLGVAFGIPSIAHKAVTTLWRGRTDSNCLMFLAALGALGFREYTEAAAVTFLFALSEWLETRATTRGRTALAAILELRPEYATLVHPQTKQPLLIPASAVPLGAICTIKTGDKLPCDGIILEGQSAVDESSLTGESRPVKKRPGSLVSGGTVNCGQNHLMMQTTSTADNSAISRLVSLVEEAQVRYFLMGGLLLAIILFLKLSLYAIFKANRSETEKLVDEFAKVYTPIVVLAALCMCTIPWFFGREAGQKWTYNGLVLIVVACPCALIISTPVTYVAGLAATAQRGVLIKGGAHLESLGLIGTICFDKTGTLTQGSFALIALNVVGDTFTREEVLEYLVLMEERANHPLAMAIVDGAKREGVSSPQNRKVSKHTFMAGEGLRGLIDGKEIYVGNSRLFERLGFLDDDMDEELENMIWNWEAMAGTVGFLSVDGELVCVYCVADAIRDESLEVVDALHDMGIDVHMLTGDNAHAAKAVGQMVGLKEEGINSSLLPEEKLKFITDLKGNTTGRTILTNPMGKRELVVRSSKVGLKCAPSLRVLTFATILQNV